MQIVSLLSLVYETTENGKSTVVRQERYTHIYKLQTITSGGYSFRKLQLGSIVQRASFPLVLH